MASRQAELEVRGLSLAFGGIQAIKDVSLSVHTGELVAVIGPNGAGKTSLLNCITGFYRATSGDIVFKGKAS
jgi:branched-chain amino acid transport system ATP-binding protein